MSMSASDYVKSGKFSMSLTAMSKQCETPVSTLKDWYAHSVMNARFKRIHEMCVLERQIESDNLHDVKTQSLMKIIEEIDEKSSYYRNISAKNDQLKIELAASCDELEDYLNSEYPEGAKGNPGNAREYQTEIGDINARRKLVASDE